LLARAPHYKQTNQYLKVMERMGLIAIALVAAYIILGIYC